ncbi:MAG TPA: carboxypeptidase regulatory-like domain-containing protein, partial [Acidimicrobiales bacterium]|nr:carboxypeptidase regulatory-like domain-containing protein [Acidimicrobiales bacterium]
MAKGRPHIETPEATAQHKAATTPVAPSASTSTSTSAGRSASPADAALDNAPQPQPQPGPGLLGAGLFAAVKRSEPAPAVKQPRVGGSPPACTNFFTGIQDLNWNNLNNWSAARVPISTDVACVLGPLVPTYNVNSTILALNAPSGVTFQSGQLTITDTAVGEASAIANLAMSGGRLTVHGDLVLTSASALNGIVDATTLEVPAAGSVTAGSSATVNPSVSTLTITNNGTVTVPNGTTLTVNGTFSNDTAGSVVANGTANVTAFTQGAGTTSGANPVNVLSALTFSGAGQSAFNVPGNRTVALTGDIGTSQSVTVTGTDYCGGDFASTLIASTSFTNNGTLTLAHTGGCGAGKSSLSVDGTFTNAANALFKATATSNPGEPQEVFGDVVNNGTVSIQGGTLYFRTSGDTWANNGPLTTAANSVFSLGNGTTFTNGSGGKISNAGSITSAGQMNQGNGTAPGVGQSAPGQPGPYNDLRLTNGAGIAFTGTGVSAYAVQPNSAITLSGNLSVDQRLTAISLDGCGGDFPATVNTSGDVSSAGVIELFHTSTCGAGLVSLNVAANTTLTSTGTIKVDGDGGPHAVNGSVHSLGTFVQTAGTTSLTGAFFNQGPFTVASPATLTTGATSVFTNASGGAIAVANPSASFTAAGEFIEDEGGTDQAQQPVIVVNKLTFTGGGNSSFRQPPNTTTTIAGDMAAGQILAIQGQDSCGGDLHSTANLVTDMVNAGTIHLTHISTCGAGTAFLNIAPGKTLTNTGQFLADGDGGAAGHLIAGTFVNEGTMQFTAGHTALAQPTQTIAAGHIVNLGGLAVAAGASVGVPVGAFFTNGQTTPTGPTGTPISVTNNGVVASSGSVFQGAGTTTGNDLLVTGALTYTGGGASKYKVPPGGAVNLAGDLAFGQLLKVAGLDGCGGNFPATATATGSFTNAGTITIDHESTCSTGLPKLVVPPGATLFNSMSGVVAFTGAGGPHELAGDFVNEGVVEATLGTVHYRTAGSTWDNGGKLTVNPGTTLSLGPNTTFVVNDGSVRNQGTLTSAAAIVQKGGTALGEGQTLPGQSGPYNDIQLIGGSLDYQGSGPGAFMVSPNSAITLSGAMHQDQRLTIRGLDGCGGSFPATATTVGNVTAGGTIELRHTSTCSGGNAGLVVAPGTVLTNTGTLSFTGDANSPPSGPPHSITGVVANTGLMHFETGRTNLVGPGSLINSGSVVVETMADVIAQPGFAVANPAGDIHLDSAFTSLHSFDQGGGTTSGTKKLTVAAGSLAFTGPGSSNFEVPPNTSVTLLGASVGGQHLTIRGLDGCGGSFPATATAAVDFTNGGLITLQHESTCAGGTATLTAASGKVITNNGTIEGLTQGSGPLALAAPVHNNGLITVTGGVLNATAPITNAGVLTTAYNGTLNGTDLVQTPTGRVHVNVNGAPNSGAFSHLNFSGAAALDGFLQVLQTNNYTPVLNDAFAFMTYGSATGTFHRVQGQISPTRAFGASYAPTHADLVVSPSDLHVGLTSHDVTAPAAGPWPGRLVTAQFQVTSAGPDTAPGPWTDSVYVSQDGAYDPADVLLQRIERADGLDANDSYTVDVSAFMPHLPAGAYKLIVVPDSGGRVSFPAFNTFGASPNFNVVDPPLLAPGVPVPTTVAAGQDLYYRVDVPTTEDVRVTATPTAGGVVELIGAAGRFATEADHDRLSSKATGPVSFTATQAQPGIWYIDLHGNPAAGAVPGTPVTVQATLPGLVLDRLAPDTGANKGPVTLDLEGADYGPDLALRLMKNGSPVRTAANVDRTDSTIAFGTFDLNGVTPDVYDLELQSNGHTTLAPNAFTVNDGPGGQLHITSSAPDSIRFGWPGNVDVTVKNTGGTDVIVPVLRLSATQNCEVALPGSSLFGPSVDIVNPDFSSASPHPLPKSVLPPGLSATFHFQVKSTSTVAHSRLETQAQAVSTASNAPVDWPAQLASAQPEQLSPATWATVVSHLAAALGATQADYARSLRATFPEAESFGVEFASEAQMLQYLVRRQLATDSAAPVSGTLYLHDGSTPLPDVPLHLGDADDPAQHSTVSWHDGRFAFWDVPATPLPLEATAYTPRPAATVSPTPTATGLVVIVEEGAALTGVVRGNGVPVAGAVVSATDGQGTVASPPTGADGVYRVDGLLPGSATAVATGPGFLASNTGTATVATGPPATLDLALAPGALVHGTITANGGGAPPADTTVWATPTDGTALTVAGVVQPDGTYTIAGLPEQAGPPPHGYTVTAQAPDGGSGSASPVTVTLAAPTNGVDVELGLPKSVTGTVTDVVTGTPVAGITVSTDARGVHRPVKTDGAGHYAMPGASVGSQHLLFTPPDLLHVAQSITVNVPAGGLVQNAVLQQYGTVDITLQTPAAAPLPQQAIRLLNPTHTDPDGVYVQDLATDVNGHTSATGLLPGSYLVQVIGSDTTTPFSINAGNLHPSLTVDVPVAGLQGTVTKGGNPVAGVVVSVADASRQLRSAKTDGSGHYAFSLSKSQTVDVIAADPDFGLAVASGQAVTAGSTATVNLAAGSSSLAVTVTSSAVPVQDAMVSLSAGAAKDQPAAVDASTNASGVGTITGLSPGSYTLTVTKAGLVPTVQPVVIAAGANNAAASLAVGGTIAGRVTNAGGNVAGAAVRIGVPAGRPVVVLTGAEGKYTVGDLAPGSYDVSVSDGPDAPARFTDVSVLSGGTTTQNATLSSAGSAVTLQLQPGPGGLPAVNVAVLDASGAQVDTAVLGPALSASSSTASTEIGPLANGSYTLVVNGPGSATLTQAMAVPPAGTVSLAAPSGELLLQGPDVADALPGAAVAHSRPRVADQVSVSAGELVRSWLGGDLFPPPEENGGEASQTQWFHRLASILLNTKCPDYDKLNRIQNEMKALFKRKNDAFQAWLLAYQSMKETGSADLIIAANNVIQSANAALQTAATFASPAGALLSQAENATANGLGKYLAANGESLGNLNSAIGAMLGMPNAVMTAIGNSISSPSTAFDTLLSNINILNNALQPLVIAASAQWPGAGYASTLLNLGATLRSAYNDLMTAFGNANAALNAALQAQDHYKRAFDDLNKALQNFELGTFEKDCHPPPPPPDPPPPPPGPNTSTDNHLPGDPNEIVGPTGFGGPRWLAGEPALSYIVHFQNDPQIANAAAVEVTVTELVPASVDPDSVELGGFAFGSTVVPVPGGRQAYATRLDKRAEIGDFVDVSGRFDRSTKVITWVLSTINPDTGDLDTAVDAGFLPVDNAAGDGEGFVSWSGRALPGLATGTAIP